MPCVFIDEITIIMIGLSIVIGSALVFTLLPIDSDKGHACVMTMTIAVMLVVLGYTSVFVLASAFSLC